MARTYQWTDDEDFVAMDAVTVSIGTDTRILKIAGLEFGEPRAYVFWPEKTGAGADVQAQSNGPFQDILAALEYAEKMSMLYGFSRVVVVLQDRALWSERWGKLSAKPNVD